MWIRWILRRIEREALGTACICHGVRLDVEVLQRSRKIRGDTRGYVVFILTCSDNCSDQLERESTCWRCQVVEKVKGYDEEGTHRHNGMFLGGSDKWQVICHLVIVAKRRATGMYAHL